jgi:hypothetical protein
MCRTTVDQRALARIAATARKCSPRMIYAASAVIVERVRPTIRFRRSTGLAGLTVNVFRVWTDWVTWNRRMALWGRINRRTLVRRAATCAIRSCKMTSHREGRNLGNGKIKPSSDAWGVGKHGPTHRLTFVRIGITLHMHRSRPRKAALYSTPHVSRSAAFLMRHLFDTLRRNA